MSREIKVLVLGNENAPFEEWYSGIKDPLIRRKILVAITRLADPSFKNFKSVGEGVFELRVFLGPGYRIYFAQLGNTTAILIGGGDKSSQHKDIYEAKKIWRSYKAAAKTTVRQLPSFRS